MKLSYTNVKTFRDCPKRYEYKYIQHLPEPLGIELKVGTAGHKVLESYYFTGSILPRSQELINNIINEVCEDAEVRDILMVALDGYHAWASVEDAKITIKKVEQDFTLGIGDYLFTGKIDAIGEMDGEQVLLEHKFKSQWGTDVAEQFGFDEQNKGYALATGCRQILYNLIRTKPAKTRPKFERVSILVPDAEVLRFREDLGLWNHKIEEAKRTNQFPRNRGFMCKYCPFVAECYDIQFKSKEI